MAAPTTARPPPRHRRRHFDLFAAATLLLAVTGAFGPALAQSPPPGTGTGQVWVGVPQTAPPRPREADNPNAQMLVQADQINYDYTNERVAAVGHVQMYYKGSSIEADRVVYDQRTKRLRAEGNVRIVQSDGQIVNGEVLDLNDDYRDGFVDSLRLEAPDQTRFAAPRAERGKGSTVFHSGTYTACEPCKDDPTKPPKWQIKADRILHDEAEKMLYFENMRLEAFGVPLFWAPFLSAPDPTVKRKSGWLIPLAAYSSTYGFAVTAPYYWALSPSYDVTITPTITSGQGLLLQGEWRQRLENGSYMIHAAGIDQLNPQAFAKKFGPDYPGNTHFRGTADSSGQFSLNDKWVWGWDALLLSDKFFLQDYGLYGKYAANANSFRNQVTEGGTSQLYLIGRGDRSYFDARVMYFYGLAAADTQSQLPIVAPVIDYARTFGQPILGGELSVKANLTSLTRQSAEFDAISNNAITTGLCNLTSADPAARTPANCLLRGIPGEYTRASAEVTWKRTFVDPIGQMFTPFVSLRADVAQASITNEFGVSNFVNTGNNEMVRVMPTVGLEYRYPFIGVHSWGTQTIEPIAQVILRPNETSIGKMPNEDAQSLIFDDSNLFSVNKFSGWDRVEGGGRLNSGVQYTAQFNQGGNLNALFGESYQLFGLNSFAATDPANTGIDSGLASARSDYVARLSYQPDRTYMFTSRFRFEHDTFALQRAEFEARVNFDRWTLSGLYGNYAPQPDIGFLTRRDGLLGTATVKLTPNWAVLGAARYDLVSEQIDQLRTGLGYIDDCFAISVNYIKDYSYSGTSVATVNNTVMLQISLRTLGTTGFTQSITGLGGLGGSLPGL
jgi:LPS-assembly protein